MGPRRTPPASSPQSTGAGLPEREGSEPAGPGLTLSPAHLHRTCGPESDVGGTERAALHCPEDAQRQPQPGCIPGMLHPRNAASPEGLTPYRARICRGICRSFPQEQARSAASSLGASRASWPHCCLSPSSESTWDPAAGWKQPASLSRIFRVNATISLVK